MSSVLIVKCDRCLAKIESDRTVLVIETGPLRRQFAHLSVGGRPQVDLCGPCCRALVEQFMPATINMPTGEG